MDTQRSSFLHEAFLTPYNPSEWETSLYEKWVEQGCFTPEKVSLLRGHTPKESFSLVMPPPNVTGVLHMGHALGITIEDIFVRYHRMKGDDTLYIPGTDHAAIATQSKVEKEITKKEGKSRYDIGREELLSRIEKFATESHDTIVSQIQALGASCDWTREAFTLDETRSRAVREAFSRMYEDGLIYQGERIVNWDPKGQTTIADDEVVYAEEKTKFYYLKYGPFTIGTARPETKFGDKYVVMHPDDARYRDYTHGQTLTVEWINGPIEATVIKDESIDMEFGTGVMTITPWHSVADFDIAERHSLEKTQIIDTYGKLLPIAGEFHRMKIKDARDKIIEKLSSKGLVEKVEDYTHNVATAERTGGIIEPQIMKQWFVAVNTPFTVKEVSPLAPIPGIKKGDTITLKQLMRNAIEKGGVTILPEHFTKTYLHWIDNLRDWCISRQIWYGHRIPVWYRGEELIYGSAPEEDGWVQDEDTLDTWFSSALWTFSTLGWPDTETFEKERRFHPTALLETGYEILFFWVARMILMSGYFLGELPFKTVYLHGTVRDAKGQKMSKSLGNGLDPLEIKEKYGADAGRMSLVMGSSPGIDMRISDEKIRGQKHFANKLWNIARFCITNLEDYESLSQSVALPESHPFLVHRDSLKNAVKEVTEHLDAYRVHLAAERTYHFIWKEFADVVIEESKTLLSSTHTEEKLLAQTILKEYLTTSLALLHPFMPFVTEAIWTLMPPSLKKSNIPLVVSPWPEAK